MVRIRATMPLRFLWQHKLFSGYVKDRCSSALSLAFAAIWEAKVGSAFAIWKGVVVNDKRRDAERAARRYEATHRINMLREAWVKRNSMYLMGSAVETWKWFAAKMKWWQEDRAARIVRHPCCYHCR